MSTPPDDSVIAALSRATAPRLSHLLLASLLFAACSGSDASGVQAASSSAAQGADERRVDEGAGDVVIAPPPGPYTVAPVASPGSVSGMVSFNASVQPAAPAATGADSALCGASIADESVRVAPSGGVAGAVVWIADVRAGKALPLERRIELESDTCILKPRVQAMLVGGAVNLIAHDSFRQQLRFVAGGEDKARGAVPLGGDEQVIPTDLPARAPGLVIVRDASRPWSRAFLAVFDHPYHAVTGPDGMFSLDGVPPGTHTLRVWHERGAVLEQQITVSSGAVARADVKLMPR